MLAGSHRIRRLLALTSATVASLLSTSAVAGAATLGVNGDTLSYSGDPNLRESIAVTYDAASARYEAEWIKASSHPASLALGAGCEPRPPEDGERASCSSAGVANVVVDVGDNDDPLYPQFGKVLGTIPARVTLRAADGPSWLIGSDGDDLLEGRGGVKSCMWGNPGNDTIRGGTATDRIEGGAGDDDIHGGQGPDRLYGEWGQEACEGTSGVRPTAGITGNDRIDGGPGNDIMAGDGGDDTLRADAPTDRVFCDWDVNRAEWEEAFERKLAPDGANDTLFAPVGLDDARGCETVNRVTVQVPKLAVSAPKQGLAAVLKNGFRFSVSTPQGGGLTSRLSLSKATAKQLKMSRQIAVGFRQIPAGRSKLVLKLNREARNKLGRLRRVSLTIAGELNSPSGASAGQKTYLIKR